MTSREMPPDVEPDRTVDNRGRGCANGIVQTEYTTHPQIHHE